MLHTSTYYECVSDGLFRVYLQDGVQGLWAGCGSSLVLVINPAIQFMAYEAIKRLPMKTLLDWFVFLLLNCLTADHDVMNTLKQH